MRPKAFTLLEMVVTLAIIVTIFIIALPQFGRFKEKSALNQTAESIRRLILEAKTKAMAPSETTDQTSFYVILCKKQACNYPLTLKYRYSPCESEILEEGTIRNEEFSEGIEISNINPNLPGQDSTYVEFKVGAGDFSCLGKDPLDKSFWGDNRELIVTLEDTRTFDKKYLHINRYSGGVWVE